MPESYIGGCKFCLPVSIILCTLQKVNLKTKKQEIFKEKRKEKMYLINGWLLGVLIFCTCFFVILGLIAII